MEWVPLRDQTIVWINAKAEGERNEECSAPVVVTPPVAEISFPGDARLLVYIAWICVKELLTIVQKSAIQR